MVDRSIINMGHLTLHTAHQRRSFHHTTQRTTHALGLSATGHFPCRALYRLVGDGGVVGVGGVGRMRWKLTCMRFIGSIKADT